MPNWVTNKVIVKGTEKQLLNIINDGLKGSGLAPMGNIEEALRMLNGSATHTTCGKIERGLTIRTFINCKEERSEMIAKIGCKWDSELENPTLRQGNTMLTFTCETAYEAPNGFLQWLAEHGPEVFTASVEEGLDTAYVLRHSKGQHRLVVKDYTQEAWDDINELEKRMGDDEEEWPAAFEELVEEYRCRIYDDLLAAAC